MRRTVLFLPGNSPNMIINGGIFGSDSLILDLEDGVSVSQKDAARYLVRESLRTLDFGSSERIIRINGMNTPFWKQDLNAVIPMKPEAVMVTKAGCADDILKMEAEISRLENEFCIPQGSIQIAPLLETASGVENAYQIAASSPRVKALYLGAEDLTADLRCGRTKEGREILYAREKIVYSARAAGREAYDTPFADINDMNGLEEDTKTAKSLGFTGKMAVSPRQLGCIRRIFYPSPDEILYARAVYEAAGLAKRQGKGVVSLDGKMIDAPIVLRARQVLEEIDEGE